MTDSKTPKDAIWPLQQMLDESERSLDTTWAGVIGMERLLNDMDRGVRPGLLANLAGDHYWRELMTNEIRHEAPTLMRQFLITHWCLLEDCVKSCAAHWFESDYPTLKPTNIPTSIQRRFDKGQYASAQDRRRGFIDSIDKAKNGYAIKQCPRNFDKFFACFNVNVHLPQTLKEVLAEYGNTRNVIMHCNSVVDEDYVRHVLNTKYRVGDRIICNFSMAKRFITATLAYLNLICVEVRIRFGDDMFLERRQQIERWHQKYPSLLH
ncbi:MAG: hypothetical protein ACFHWZ_13925 [Phycisphaerales bacterium]